MFRHIILRGISGVGLFWSPCLGTERPHLKEGQAQGTNPAAVLSGQHPKKGARIYRAVRLSKGAPQPSRATCSQAGISQLGRQGSWKEVVRGLFLSGEGTPSEGTDALMLHLEVCCCFTQNYTIIRIATVQHELHQLRRKLEDTKMRLLIKIKVLCLFIRTVKMWQCMGKN